MTDLGGLDRERLAAWLTARLRDDGVAVEAEVDVELLGTPPSGNSNVTLPFAARWHSDGHAVETELVLRMQTPTNQIFLDVDVLREHRVLTAVHALPGFPSPAPRWAEPDPAVLGQPFFVMERLRGVVPAGTPSIHVTGWLSTCTPDEVRTAWASATAALAGIHAVDWRATVPFLADAPVGTTLEQRVAHLAEWYEWARAGRTFPVTDAALDHLARAIPRCPGPAVLVWGDARLGNVMFGADHRLRAVLDWELASIGPAAIDVGWWSAMDEFQTRAHGIEAVAGYPGRAALIARYEQLTGNALEDLRWYEILCAFVLTVTVIRMADIGVSAGRLAPDQRMGHGNLAAQMLARWLDLPIPDLDPAYAARRGLDVG